ncbi:MAG TPA: hypothetical protein VGM56_30820 [Byssovorax sp.]|jgi:hypothetical protein
MHTRTRNSLVVGVLAVVLAGGLVATAHEHRANPLGGGRALDAVPAGALLVASADLAALRGAGAFGEVLQRGREIQGVGKVKDICGFDPIEQIDGAALAIPAANTAGDFGLVAVGTFDDEAILACAAKVIAARGGRPVTTPLGGFRSVHDGASAEGGEIAVKRGGGLMLLGGGSYLRAMVDASEGRIPNVHTSAGHAELARAVGDGAVRLTFVLSPEQRAAMSADLPRASTIVGGAVSVGLGEKVDLHAALRCDTSDACVELSRAVAAVAKERASDTKLRLVGFGSVLDRLSVDAEGPYVHARVTLPPDEAAHLVDMALKLRGFSHPMPNDAAPAAPPASAPALPSASAVAPPSPATAAAASAAPAASAPPAASAAPR